MFEGVRFIRHEDPNERERPEQQPENDDSDGAGSKSPIHIGCRGDLLVQSVDVFLHQDEWDHLKKAEKREWLGETEEKVRGQHDAAHRIRVEVGASPESDIRSAIRLKRSKLVNPRKMARGTGQMSAPLAFSRFHC